ncbi:hypothetical protein QBC37DRAFT_48564 [Rhypophila decipiens]|uniref:Uncharacterized protein n=1 Tax=Rhypophila decipiens TaxID=261697 RepID=A0AAN6Y3X8_9PEZI|nr:hypothetical protein QBC37DRAFT_48564 [Rhypophila decipiens]
MALKVEVVREFARLNSQDVRQEYAPSRTSMKKDTSRWLTKHVSSVFIVHGFQGHKYRHLKSFFEHWVLEKAGDKNIPVTVYALRFDALAIPYRGTSILEDAVWDLRLFLLKLLHETADREVTDDDTQEPESEENSPTEDDIDTSTADTSPRSNRRITFVAHGLGSWIVKGALDHPNMDSIAYMYNRTDLKFFDAGVEIGAHDAYKAYLERIWATFSIGPAKHKDEAFFHELVSYLQEVDEKFDTFAGTQNAAAHHTINKDDPRPSTIYKEADHRIWMSGRRTITQTEQGWRFSRLLSGTQAPLRLAPVVDKLPKSLDATLPFAPRLQATSISRTSGGATSPTKPLSPTVNPPSPISLSAEAYLYGDRGSPLQEERAGYILSGRLKPIGSRVEGLQVPKDHDRLSIVSTPDKDFITMSDSHLQSACKLANTFLQKGDLQKANVLFDKVVAHTSSQDRGPERISMLMQRASVKIYRGYYQSGMGDLDDIRRSLQTAKLTRPAFIQSTYLCRRWMASCELYAGRWRDAATRMQRLLDDDSKRYHVRLHRDQALAHAYLGEYSSARSCLELAKKRASNMKRVPNPNEGNVILVSETGTPRDSGIGEETAVDPKDERERLAKGNSLKAAQACIDMLAGDYLAALKQSSEALNYMRATVGGKHFRTLATATLKAWSLAYNGRYGEAETLCSTTYKATKAALGRNHPQTLDTTNCMIYLYRAQGRFAEAVGTGMSATSMSLHGGENMRDHPQHIHVEFQLAQSFLANGDYLDSKAAFAKLLQRATRVMGDMHPETLRYRAEQARVLLKLGNINKARKLAFSVTVKQFQVYHQNLNQRSSIIANACESLLSRDRDYYSSSRLSTLATLLKAALDCSSPSTILHPFLLSTLQLTANIEIRNFQLAGNNIDSNTEALAAAAQNILETLHEYHLRKEQQDAISNPDMTINHLPTTSTALDLATLLKEQPNTTTNDNNDLAKAIEYYKYGYNTLKTALGDNHLTTLLAQRDLTITQTLKSAAEAENTLSLLRRVKVVSDCLCKKLDSRLGLLHPETLTMRLWCFTVDLLVCHSSHRHGDDSPQPHQSQTQSESQSQASTLRIEEDCDENDINQPDTNRQSSNNPDGSTAEAECRCNAVWKEINTSLQDPTVIGQRLVESLAMRRQLAGLLTGTGRNNEALVVIGNALRDIKRALVNPDLTGDHHHQVQELGQGEKEDFEEKEIEEDQEEEEEGLKETLRDLEVSFEGMRDEILASA